MNRRNLVRSAAGFAAAATVLGVPRLTRAQSRAIAITMWGGAYMEGARPIYEDFQKRTGIRINVELHAGAAAAVVSRIAADLPQVSRDVVAAYDPVFIAMDNEGWLDEITPDKVPRMRDLYPLARFTNPSSGKVVALGWTLSESGWYYRTDLIPKDLQPLSSMEQLLDPRLKGKVYIRPPAVSAGANLISIALGTGGSERNLEPAWEMLRLMADHGQIGGLPKSESEVYQALATGDGWITFGGFANAGALLGYGIPIARVKSEKMKSYATVEGYCVPKGPRLQEAYEWMRFFYTPENLGRQCAATKQVPSLAGAPVDPLAAKFALNDEEQSRFVFKPDFTYVNSQVSNWVKQFERDILPRIKG